MTQGRRQRPPSGNVLALIALVVAVAGGSAYAGSQLARNEVKAKHIAPNAVTNKHTRNLTVSSVRRLPASEEFADAKVITLLRRGPFRLIARCYRNESLDAGGLIELKLADGTRAIGHVDNNYRVGGNYFGSDANVYSIVGGTVPTDVDGVDYENRPLMLIARRTVFEANVRVFVKAGTLPAGNGPYLPGNGCIFQATETGSG